MSIATKYRHWLRTGRVPTRREFGPAFQDDWRTPVNDCTVSLYRDRREVIRQYGFALPCHEAISALKKLSPILEVGAGAGTWAAILKMNGVDIIATDRNFNTDYGFHAGRHYPVTRMSADNAIHRRPDRNVLMIWPCYQDEWSTRAVRLIKPGKHLALIGEGAGGCTGTDNLFNHLDKYYRHKKTIRIPCWYGIHDRLDIYQRAIGAPPPPEKSW